MHKANETTTYSAKMDTSTKEELQNLIQSYAQNEEDATAEDFIKILIDTYKMHNLTNSVIDVRADIKELNQLTSRIYNLYNGLIERTNTNINNIKIKAQEQLDISAKKIEELQRKISDYEQDIHNKNDLIQKIKEENEHYINEINNLKDAATKDNMLIKRLENEVLENSHFKEENKKITIENTSLNKQMSDLKTLNDELKNRISLKVSEIDSLKKNTQRLKESFEDDITRIKNELNIEKQQEILQNKQEYIKILQEKDIEIYNTKTKKIEDIGRQQEKYIKYIHQLESDKQVMQKEIEMLKDKIDSIGIKKTDLTVNS